MASLVRIGSISTVLMLVMCVFQGLFLIAGGPTFEADAAIPESHTFGELPLWAQGWPFADWYTASVNTDPSKTYATLQGNTITMRATFKLVHNFWGDEPLAINNDGTEGMIVQYYVHRPDSSVYAGGLFEYYNSITNLYQVTPMGPKSVQLDPVNGPFGWYTVHFVWNIFSDSGRYDYYHDDWQYLELKEPPPTAYIDQITPSPAKVGQPVHFVGYGVAREGSIINYQWRSSIDGVFGSSADFSYSSLSQGTHEIFFKVQEDDGAWSEEDPQTLDVEPAVRPIAYIDYISPESAYAGDSVSFSGHGFDPDGGSIIAYEWKSDKDGTISTLSSFTKSSLSVGTHTISFKVRDSDDNLWSSAATLGLDIMNRAPVAHIDSITPSPDVCVGVEVEFKGSGTDPNGDSIIAYSWRSSIDGPLSSQSQFTKSTLSAGTHTIYFKVQDGRYSWSSEDSRQLTVFTPSGGFAIIVCGGAGDAGEDRFEQHSQRAYDAFVANGFTDDQIYYLGYDDTAEHVDAVATWANLDYAITEWATLRVNSETPLYLFLRDHGGTDHFELSLSDYVWADELVSWLNQVEASQIIVIIDSCHSGSFVDDLTATNRIIITSCGPSEDSWNDDEDDDGVWEINFSYVLFGSIMNGLSLGDSFDEASAVINRYFGQNPLLEDEGDTDGGHTAPLPNEGEGEVANEWHISSLDSEESLPIMEDTCDAATIPLGGSLDIWAIVTDDSGIRAVTAALMPPSYVPPSGTDPVLDLPSVRLYDTIGTGNYSATYAGFNELGTYRIVICAIDTNGNVNTSAPIFVQVVSTDNQPPTAAIASISPNPAYAGESVAFYGIGEDVDGTIEEYSWQSSIDGPLSSETMFVTSSLSIGSHIITLKVMDDDGAWSLEASTVLEIQNPPSDPGALSSIRIDGGTGAFSTISNSIKELVVDPGDHLIGALTLTTVNSWVPIAAVTMMGTTSWGTHSQSYWTVGSIGVGQNTYTSGVDVVAPLEPGTYYLIFAMRGEFTGAQVASATNWFYGSPVWDDGNDIADFAANQIAAAQAVGRANGLWLLSDGYSELPIPADAITVSVNVPLPYFEVSVSTDRTLYAIGEPVIITASITNTGNAPGTLFFPSWPICYFTVQYAFWIVYDSRGHYSLPVITDIVLNPGETYEAKLIWEQVDNYGNQVPYPAQYTIVAGFMPNGIVLPEDYVVISIGADDCECLIDLEAGWNIVSIPPLIYALHASSLGLDAGSVVAKWDGTVHQYFEYIVGISPQTSDFDLEPGHSYWVYSQAEQSIAVRGCTPSQYEGRTCQLDVPQGGGWVMIGFNSITSGVMASSVAGMIAGAQVTIVCQWNSALGQYVTYIPGLALGDFAISPGEGCWIWVSGPCTLTVTP